MFEDTRSGLKEIETRAATIKYQDIAPADVITFVCGKDTFTKTVGEVYRWPDIETMLEAIPIARIMPRLSTLAEVQKAYASYPGYAEKIRQHGLIGFTLV